MMHTSECASMLIPRGARVHVHLSTRSEITRLAGHRAILSPPRLPACIEHATPCIHAPMHASTLILRML